MLHRAEDEFSTKWQGRVGTGRALRILHIQMFIKVVPSKVIICFAAVYSSAFGQEFPRGLKELDAQFLLNFSSIPPLNSSGLLWRLWDTKHSLCNEFKQTVGICEF